MTLILLELQECFLQTDEVNLVSGQADNMFWLAILT